ncbi:MAG TPA: PBP1A family penicillin-binding protein [Spirochaetota bacterium]|nr:PBP1A family penicillin-binding protein [Spirochaetota bacterium]HPC43060.1 PBP1A family penicillin-binding protein [Spirochaetota bacterium]HPL17285.1 PBP1A family penicillin-binding protein [Spirochaetota bacterium]HQF06922.1 PBP1A family penicillin-binding protein [Spirochaetota bacterium]HQH95459.1 PBP1A family penicillin-binding protein [Spirochaetota bacterium]
MKQPKALPIKILLVAVILLPFAYILSAYTYSYSILTGELAFDPGVSTKIYDCNGDLISELYEENRTIPGHGAVPDTVKRAFLAAEDRNFYLHSGFDIPGIVRAVVVDILSGGIKQGGSTITQQLVKQLYTGRERTVRRKLIEIFVAREFEKKYTKDQIIEMYLSQIYFGHGVYGVDSASRFFFDKDLKGLNAVEAALLASIPSAPNYYSPLKNPRAAFEKSRQVLYNMIGAGDIGKEDASRQFNEFWAGYLEIIKTKFPTLGIRSRNFDRAPYFTEYIRQMLVEKFGEKAVYRGGLSVHTTLDLRHQKAAEEALQKSLEEQNRTAAASNASRFESIDRLTTRKLLREKRISAQDAANRTAFLGAFRDGAIDDALMGSLLFGTGAMEQVLEKYLDTYEQQKQLSRVEGAFISLDPVTGGITAMVGGSDFNSGNQLNRAVQSMRQPGSAFKAFVYGAGIESKRITAASSFYDVPVLFKGTRTVWKPSNYEKTFRGRVLVRNALAASLNIISVLVVDEVEPRLVAEFASRLMGIPLKRFSVDPTISLGTSEVSPLEMARGFAVYANGGREITPHAIRSITDRQGKNLLRVDDADGRGKRLISEETAFIMTSLLRSVVDSGTATGGIRNAAGFSLPAAGKTGTTTNFKDAWFVGFTPDLVAAVWMGCDSQKYSLGIGQSASVVAAPVWGNFMSRVYTFRKPGRFRGRPDGVTSRSICARTGLAPVDGCPVKSEYFIAGTEPREKCNSDHDEMTSIFDLVRKKKGGLLEKEKSKISDHQSREED